MLPDAVNKLAKIILEPIKEYLEDFIDRRETGVRSVIFCIGHIKNLRIIIEQCAGLR